MAQGTAAKLAKKKKSAGAQKRKMVRKKTVAKGPRECKQQRSSVAAHEKTATTKAINRKNEAAIAAKAVAVGTKFFLGDVSAKGEKEMQKQLRERDKKQSKGGGAADRLKSQLRKLGKNV